MYHSWQNASESSRRLPRLASSEVALPPHVYRQDEILDAFARKVLPDTYSRRTAERIYDNCGVRTRHLVAPLERLLALEDFTEANELYLESALDLGESALHQALDAAGVMPNEVDAVFSTTITGLAVPSLEARLARRVGFRADIKRVPLFGLGCAAGAAGIARMYDYLCAWPDQVAVLLSVELCTLTLQQDDPSLANIVGTGLFGDGAAAVVALGGDRNGGDRDGGDPTDGAGPEIVSTRSRLYPETEDVMGWKVGTTGFRLVLAPDVPDIAEEFLSKDVHGFLTDHGLSIDDLASWVCHPGGPKVIDAIERSLGLPTEALAYTRDSLANIGNLSSASVLHVLHKTLREPRPLPGSPGILLAMGPGFCSELVLLRW